MARARRFTPNGFPGFAPRSTRSCTTSLPTLWRSVWRERTPGYIVGVAGPLVGALVFVGAVALLGAFSYIFITGDVHRIELTEKT